MKTFNVKEDQFLNEMAVEFAGGNEIAGDKFMEIVEPKMKSYARKMKTTFHSEMEVEDIAQEFLLVAVKCCYKFAERYNDGKNNVLGLIYGACRNKFQDIGRTDSAEMRSGKMQVGVDENGDPVYENREISLQTTVGEDGESTMADKVASNQKSVEAQVEDSFTETTLEMVVKDFVSNTKGRNAKIVPLIYVANKLGWELEELNDAISQVLKDETGEEPKSDAIRQAKSRAMKALRKAIETGTVAGAGDLMRG